MAGLTYTKKMLHPNSSGNHFLVTRIGQLADGVRVFPCQFLLAGQSTRLEAGIFI
jgi:hypothetical protein